MENDYNSFEEVLPEHKELIRKISKKVARMYEEGRVKAEVEIDDFRCSINLIGRGPKNETSYFAYYRAHLEGHNFKSEGIITIVEKFNPHLN